MNKKIFLLATGQSINDITEEQWEYIKSHDSIGVSWFYKKGFETTYYYTHEYDKQPSCVANNILNNNWKTKVFFGTIEVSGEKLNYINSSYTTFNSFKDKLNCEEVKFSHWLSAWNGKPWLINEDKPPLSFKEIWANEKNDVLFGFRGTMMCALNLCSVLGYDEIILCGVDLKNGLHFYDEVKSVYSNQFGTDSIKDKHSTCVDYRGVRPVIDALNWIKPNLNIKVSSKNSLLYENGFELYEF
jgi:hypothetical protein